jgi:hypothetical protein
MWHFTTLDKKLGYGDGRLIIAGEKLTVPGPIVLCKSGLHASKRLLDALKYAPGAYLWEVELSGEVIHGDDKSVATERTALCGFDASEVLRKFSRMVALQAVEKHWDESKLGAFPDVTLQWLKTGDETLRVAARSAARSAAWAAEAAGAEAAAWAAAGAAQETLLLELVAAARNEI